MKKLLSSPFFVFSLVLVALIFFLPLFDTDLGWHLRYGNYFLETGKFMRTNMITYLLPNYLWPNSYTLYQIIVSLIYKILGLFGLAFFYSIVMISTFTIYNLVFPCTKRFNILAFSTIILFGWIVFYMGIRAQIFSFLGLIYILLAIKRSENRNIFYTLPLIFLLWANLHGAFVLGLALIGFFLIDITVRKKYSAAKKTAFILALSFIATLINPYTYLIYKEVLRHMTVPLNTLIAEWVAPKLLLKLFVFFTLIFELVHIYKYKLKNKVFWIISLVVFSMMTFSAKRNMPFFALMSAAFFTEIYAKRMIKLEKNKIFQKMTNFSLLAAILYFIFINIGQTLNKTSNFSNYCKSSRYPYPCSAINYIRENNIKGENVFSSYEWGGVLAWQLPQYKFFVDGRTPAWNTPSGKSPYTIYLEIIQAQDGYQKNLEKYDTDWLLIGSGTFLDLELKNNTNTPWKEIYRDKLSVIYIQK